MSYRHYSLLPFLLALTITCAQFLSGYYQLIINLVLVWSILAVSWNLFCGYSGLISFGHAIYWGIGAYCVSLGVTQLGLSPILGLPLGIACAMLAALIIGIPTLRLSGAYFSLAMLAYPLTAMSIFTWLGYREVFLPPVGHHWSDLQFNNPIYYTILAAVMLFFAFGIHVYIHHSRLGDCLRAIRQSESAAEASGIDTWQCKLRASIISAGVAAMAGGLYALVLGVMTTDSAFGFMVSAQAVVLPLFGGVGSPWGPIIGAGFLVPVAEWLNAYVGDRLPGISGLVYGMALIAVVLAAPEGVFWKFGDLIVRRRGSPRKGRVARPNLESGPETERRLFISTRTFSIHDPILSVRGLTRSFGGVHALDGVDLAVSARTIHGIIGPNGAGKTTLFNVLNGFLRPSAGVVTVYGSNIIGHRPHDLCRMGISRTFQVPRVFGRMSVLENVRLGAYVAEKGADGATARAYSALEQVRLGGRASDPVSSLTTYEVRLLELARALASGPEIILMDEILAGIGKKEALEIEDLLLDLRRTGRTIVIIEHTMESMLRIADEFTVIDHGRTLVSGIPQEVVNQADVITAYLGEKWAAKGLVGKRPANA